MKRHTRIKWKDATQLVVGSAVLGFPMAACEEIWDLGESLPGTSFLPVVLLSLFFIGAYLYHLHYQGNIHGKGFEFIERVFISYAIALVCSATLLALLDKFPMMDETAIAMKRALLVAFPACFTATVVDSMDSTD